MGKGFAILLFVTDVTNNNPTYVSLIAVAEYAPIFLFSIIGGTFVDRWPPRRTMVWCDFLSAASVIIVLLVLIYGSWHALFFATLVSAILSQFSQPSAMKLFKLHLPAEQLQGVMAMFQSLMAVFLVVGPIIGTFVYQQYGINISISIMGIMFIASALVLYTLPRDPARTGEAVEDQHFTKDLQRWSSLCLFQPRASHAWHQLRHSRACCRTNAALNALPFDRKSGQDKSFLQ